MTCPAAPLPRLSRREGNRFPSLGATGFPRRCNQLAEHLRSCVSASIAKLAHCGPKCSPQWWWHGQTGQAPLERLNPAALGSVRRRWIEQQILGNPDGQPEGKDPAALRPASYGRQ
jgi:hypothetical protein